MCACCESLTVVGNETMQKPPPLPLVCCQCEIGATSLGLVPRHMSCIAQTLLPYAGQAHLPSVCDSWALEEVELLKWKWLLILVICPDQNLNPPPHKFQVGPVNVWDEIACLFS